MRVATQNLQGALEKLQVQRLQILVEGAMDGKEGEPTELESGGALQPKYSQLGNTLAHII